jgi:hypothetical protein
MHARQFYDKLTRRACVLRRRLPTMALAMRLHIGLIIQRLPNRQVDTLFE